MDWNDPTARLELIDRVGPDEYNRLQDEHMAASAIEVCNGHRLRYIRTRWGRLVSVDGSGSAYVDLATAREEAGKLPKGPHA